MSLIPHGFLPRSSFNMDHWMYPTLETFDPFDELDHMMATNMHWLTRPSFLEPLPAVPKIPEKYRITVECAGYSPKSLKTEFKDGKLYVSGREEEKNHDDDYHVKEFRKSYQLPPNAEVDKLASFYAGGHLVIEVPLKLEKPQLDDLFPHVIDAPNGGKQLSMKCSVPQGIDPSKISVTCKDRDLIIKAEDKTERPDGISKTFYMRRCTLPENTETNNLKCQFENNKLTISAPVNPALTGSKQVAIEHKK